MAPLPLAGIGLASTALGAGVNAIGASYAGEAKGRMYEYQAGIADLNKKIATQNADWARNVGEVKAQGSGLRTQFQIGKMRAAQGAGNIDVNSGSAQATRDSQRQIGEWDQATIRSNAARQAYGFDVEAIKYGSEAEMDRMGANTARESGKLGVISSILGGATSVASKWLQGNASGVFGDNVSDTPRSRYKPTPGYDD